MTQAESERETEFALMKEIMKKLVHALEDKASTDLLTSGNTYNSNFGYTLGGGKVGGELPSPRGSGSKPLYGNRKSSQPPPLNH